jgi:hypothetical protein
MDPKNNLTHFICYFFSFFGIAEQKIKNETLKVFVVAMRHQGTPSPRFKRAVLFKLENIFFELILSRTFFSKEAV